VTLRSDALHHSGKFHTQKAVGDYTAWLSRSFAYLGYSRPSASRFQIGGDGPVYLIFACYAGGLFVWFHGVHDFVGKRSSSRRSNGAGASVIELAKKGRKAFILSRRHSYLRGEWVNPAGQCFDPSSTSLFSDFLRFCLCGLLVLEAKVFVDIFDVAATLGDIVVAYFRNSYCPSIGFY
jgi:hypothetical protein